MSHYKRWTEDEEAVVFSQVEDCFGNLKQAFKRASKIINRTEKSVQYHWYGVMCKDPKKANTAFMTVSKKKALINKKKADDESAVVIQEESWFIKFLKNIFKCNKTSK